MVEDKNQLAGICGLYCGTCPHYLAPRSGDRETLERLAKDQDMPVEEVRCDGCLSGRVSRHCEACRHGFRDCAADQGVTWCFQCGDFPCRRLEDFKDVHVENGISHHEHVVEELQSMKRGGVAEWIRTKEEQATCPVCGSVRYWYDRECGNCSKDKNG